MPNNYKPLPDEVTVSESKIHGLGLFATSIIPEGSFMGKSHFVTDHGLERTPLGGFINHSEKSNCEKFQMITGNPNDEKFWFIRTTKDVNAGEELTLTYEWYDPKENKT